MAEVDIVATYRLLNIDRGRLGALIHQLFEPGRLDIEIPDRLGRPVSPRERYLLPHFMIDEAMGRFRDGSIVDYVYDRASARFVRTAPSRE